MLVCSSPQLIAAYHVLLRLLEPRHPPYALICFKKIQIFKSLTSLKVTRYYNFIPNMSKSYYLGPPLTSTFTRFGAGLYLVFADVMVTNHQTDTSRVVTSIILKELLRTSPLSFSASDHCVILRRAYVFKQPPAVLVEDIGVEPMTPCLQSRCSSQLS